MAAFNSDVAVTVEVAFGYGPYATSLVWTDITTDVRLIDIRRGRSHDLDRISASTLRLLIDNTTGDYDPSFTGAYTDTYGTTYSAGAYFPNVVPMVPVRVTATYSAVTYDLFYGMVEEWSMRWPEMGHDAVTEMYALDGMKLLNLMNTGSAEVQELSSVRIGNLLDDASWPATWRNLSTGDVTVQAYQPVCASILRLIRQVEDTEGGLFFIAGDGRATFQNKSFRSGAATTQTFGDSGSEIRYEDVNLPLDDKQVYNRVEVSRIGGAAVAAENVTSQSNFGKRLLPVFDTLHISDAEATTTATGLLERYNDAHILMNGLVVKPARDTKWAEVLSIEISDLVTVIRRPSTGNTTSIGMYIESIETVIDPVGRVWETTFSGTQYI